MSSKDLLLSIDIGTQSVKAATFDLQGGLTAKNQIPIDPPYVATHPGWAELDPEIFWQALCSACNGLLRNDSTIKERLAGVSLTSQRATVINVNRNGKPLRPAMHWLDQRKTHGLRPLAGWWGLFFKLLRLSDTIAYFQSEAEINWIRTYQPEVWKNTYKFLFLSGYLTWRLTGSYRDSIGCQVGYLPFDYKRLGWARDWDWKWGVLRISRDQLPDIMPPGKRLGHINRKAAEETGLPEDLPLIASAADKACEVIGSGSLEPETGCLSFGTTATINVTYDKYVEPIPLLPAYPSAIPGSYTLEVQVYRGYWMVNWFKKEFGYAEIQEAKEQGIAAEALFDRLVEDIPPGSMGLLLQPYWTPGIKQPGPEAKGAIIGFGDIHTRAHVYQSILEGLAYALREGGERIQKKTGVAITSIRVSGGGSQSRKAMQITADIFGLPTAKPQIYETSGLGAAINLAVGLGFYPDYKTAIHAMTHIGEVFEPDLKSHALYDALYHDVYKKMYKRLRPLYENIRRITGYPR